MPKTKNILWFSEYKVPTPVRVVHAMWVTFMAGTILGLLFG
jgi:hypothetical protein